MKKTCFKCGIEKDIDQFHKNKRMKDGHVGKCAECAKNDTREWTAKLSDGKRKRGALTRHELIDNLDYNADTGNFTLKRSIGPAKKGSIAGYVDSATGYVNVQLLGKRDHAHRLAWLYVHGEYPKHQMDHINGIRNDNRLCNLREATNAQNSQNHAIASNNTSGHTGISFDKKSRKYHAYIKVDGKRRHLGYFDDLADAVVVRVKAKEQLHSFCPTDR